MECLVLISHNKTPTSDNIKAWFDQFEGITIDHYHTLSCVTSIKQYNQVVIVLDSDPSFNKEIVQLVEYLNNSNIMSLFFIVDIPNLTESPSLRYFLADKKQISINSSKNINKELFGFEFHFS